VVAVARRREPLDQLSQAHRSRGGDPSNPTHGIMIPVAGDITDPATREQVIQEVAALRGGEVDLLVNNAGIGAIGSFVEATPERMRRIMEVNFFAPVELTRAMIPLLRRGRAPVICNISSVLGHCAVPGKSEYCASKFALHGWSDALRAELHREGIQVTIVSPSTTRSEFFDALIETGANATSASIGSWPPDKVARKTLAAIKSRRREVILSLGGKGLVYADRIVPSLVNAALARTSKKSDHK
jgi:short-subunit dehydrogenase